MNVYMVIHPTDDISGWTTVERLIGRHCHPLQSFSSVATNLLLNFQNNQATETVSVSSYVEIPIAHKYSPFHVKSALW